MPIQPSHIVEALSQLGGQAHLDQIVAKVIEIAPLPHPDDPGASVRARIQERCSEAKSYKGDADLFESVFGIGQRKGVWRLKFDPLDPSNSDAVVDAAEVDIEANEGRATLRIHLRRERSRKLIEAFKASLNDFSCEACGQDMETIYGELGAGYIEAHHRIPVAAIEDGEKTRLTDLAALCANCHRIIHRNGLMSVEALARHIQMQAMPYPLAAEPDPAKWEHDAPGDGD
jgi:hypothetical protein